MVAGRNFSEEDLAPPSLSQPPEQRREESSPPRPLNPAEGSPARRGPSIPPCPGTAARGLFTSPPGGRQIRPRPRLSHSPSPGWTPQREGPPFVLSINFFPRWDGDGRGSPRSPLAGQDAASPPLPVAQVAGVLSRGAAAQQQPQPQEQRQEPGERGAPHGPPGRCERGAGGVERCARRPGLAYMAGSAAGRRGYPMPGSRIPARRGAARLCRSHPLAAGSQLRGGSGSAEGRLLLPLPPPAAPPPARPALAAPAKRGAGSGAAAARGYGRSRAPPLPRAPWQMEREPAPLLPRPAWVPPSCPV